MLKNAGYNLLELKFELKAVSQLVKLRSILVSVNLLQVKISKLLASGTKETIKGPHESDSLKIHIVQKTYYSQTQWLFLVFYIIFKNDSRVNYKKQISRYQKNSL